MTTLTARFEDALLFATRAHATQTRKGSRVPYVAHLLAVAALVLEHGGDEDEAIAALLHDAIEDQGVAAEAIAARFGDVVARVVLGCTDAVTRPKPPWDERKRAYVRHLVADATPAVLLVSCADKVHNGRSIVADHRALGDALWSRFNASAAQIRAHYGALGAAFEQRREAFVARGAEGLLAEFRVVVAQVEATAPAG